MGQLDLLVTNVKAVPATVWLALLPLGAFLLYRSLQPKPLPGIPIGYPEGLDHVPWLVGFAPAVSKTMRESKGLMPLFHPAAAKFGPVWQVPIGPAGTWLARLTGVGEVLVVCADSQEIDDACSRKAAAFAKSAIDTEPFKVSTATGQLALMSGPQHRHHRRVFAPSMSGACLARLLPRIEICVDNLVSLWKARTARAKMQGGRPIAVFHDLTVAVNDVITDIVFGKSFGGIDGIHKHLDTLPSNSAPDSSPPVPRLVDGPMAPLLSYYYCHISSRTRRARQDVFKMMEARIAAERALRDGKGHRDGPVVPRDADHVIDMALDMEEADLAKGTAPLPHNELCDELLTYVFAGSETTATTLAWSVKYLSRSPQVQHRLRAELEENLPGVLRPSQQSGESSLTFDQINDETLLPYSTATAYECLRLSNVLGLIGRSTMCDTNLLGYPVPAGTRVMFLTAWAQAVATESQVREKEERATKEGRRPEHSQRKWGYWGDDVAEFRPERWLKQGPDGTTQFDRLAGPLLSFGAGPRGCFGRNLAMLNLKVFLVKLIANFFFESVPTNLNDDSAVEVPARHPTQCYVRLTPTDTPSTGS